MSIPVRHSGRIAFSALIVIALIPALLGVRLFALAPAPPAAILIDTPTQASFAIGPIEGLTTTWHSAPPATSIPLGTIAWFFQKAPPDTTVIWTGADEVARDDQGSTAVCWLVLPGIITVQVQVIPADGGEALSSRSLLNVEDIAVDQITVSPIEVWVDPVEVDEGLPPDELNEVTMDYFFGLSIAALRDLGNGQYLTSVDRLVHMAVEVDPPGFGPLMEWRFDGYAGEIGASTTTWFTDIGNHVAEVGPPLNPEQIEIETYSVTITSHTSGQDIIPEGEPVVLIAETDPPGYEDEITWLSSTKYGTAEPILGQGPIFIAEFNDTWGLDENGDPFQWLGVKADNATFNQDQKCDPMISELVEPVPEDFYDEIVLSGGPFGQHTFLCFDSDLGNLQEIRYSAIDNRSDPYVFGDGADFFLEVIDGDVLLTASRPGAYLIKEIRQFGSRITDVVWQSVPLKEVKGAKTGKKISIPTPSLALFDLIVVSNSANGPLDCAFDLITGEVPIGSVAAVNAAIVTEFVNNDNLPITLAVIDHGNCALQSMGDGNITVVGGYIKRFDLGSAADLAAFIATCNGKVSACTFYACNVADGANGQGFLQDIATGANMTVTAFSGSVICTPNFLGFFGGWSASDNGVTVTKTP